MAVSGVSFFMSSAYNSEPSAKRVAVNPLKEGEYPTFNVGADSWLDFLSEEQTGLNGPLEERVSQVACKHLAPASDRMEKTSRATQTEPFEGESPASVSVASKVQNFSEINLALLSNQRRSMPLIAVEIIENFILALCSSEKSFFKTEHKRFFYGFVGHRRGGMRLLKDNFPLLEEQQRQQKLAEYLMQVPITVDGKTFGEFLNALGCSSWIFSLSKDSVVEASLLQKVLAEFKFKKPFFVSHLAKQVCPELIQPKC